MIPQQNNDLLSDFEEAIEQPTKNYKIHLDRNRIAGFIDEIEALKQAIFLMLSIERYDHIIYSWNFGVEFKDLFGQPVAFVLPEVKRRISECLLQDDRILEIDNFIFETNKGKVHVIYTVSSIYGEFETEWEVDY